ncbi:MAG: uroporphyrinogen decarboxylase family protein [Eubacteriales bacterium]|jgi:uroporphyrinogen decarboxylase|nr:uroporphyrinogen decarboxylase family protein [Eubacteriales bacterium]
MMNSREIVRRIVAHDNPVRFGYDFVDRAYNDMTHAPSRAYINEAPNPYASWGDHKELADITGFSGQTFRDRYGNIYGRFNGLTKGECIRGAIVDWDDFERYTMPVIDPDFRGRLLERNFADSDKYVMCGGASIFSSLRDARLMANALADTVLEPDMVHAFLDRIVTHEEGIIASLGGCGIDAMMIGDDWGTQDRTFISPDSFAALFAPYYKRIADAVHEQGMALFMHSCGYIIGIMDHLIDAGVDVFQFDQPDAYPAEVLAERFGSRVCFHSPVDIQKVLPTGDRELIESRTMEMCRIFRACGGSWIAKDYPSFSDIGVKPEWAGWAMRVITENSAI